MKIFIATANFHKLQEFEQILDRDDLNIYSIRDFNIKNEPVEDGSSFKENAIIKAKFYYDLVKMPVLADDSGLICLALGDKPGIYSARLNTLYPEIKAHDNAELLLKLLDQKHDRRAYFICHLVYYDGVDFIHFEGRCDGVISLNKQGQNGFGYDPIFIPNGYKMSFAEMDQEFKNQISHRRLAVKLFNDYFKNR